MGNPGIEAVEELLPSLIKNYNVDVVIANAENAADGMGITPKIAERLFYTGVSVITSGNHIWRKKQIIESLKDEDMKILRPLNYPKENPGKGSEIMRINSGEKLAVINLMGRVFMDPLDCPFTKVMEEIERIEKETANIIVDFHAEATSEKMAMGWFLDGKVSAVVGTHTHIQTADEKILPQGTAYITDVGMTGPLNSIIGLKKEIIIRRFLTQIPQKMEVAKDDVHLQGVIVELNPVNGLSSKIIRIDATFPK